MKRVAGYVVLVVGLVLVFLSPFLLIYSMPRVEKAPTDSDERVVSDGQGTFFSAKELKSVTSSVRNIELDKGYPAKSTKDVAVIYYTSNLVKMPEGSSITYDQEVYAMNRHTGLASNCCGEQPKMSGETLKFPFGTKQQDYQLWDATANEALPVKYTRTEELDGLKTYVFVGQPQAVKTGTLDLPNSLIGVTGQGTTTTDAFYQSTTTVWVEPVTGQVLKGQKDLQQWAELNGTKVLELADLQLGYNDATVAHFASEAKKNVKQLKLVTTTLPIFGPIIGIALAVVGLMMVRPPKQASSESGKPEAKAA
jgi:Porin PorA